MGEASGVDYPQACGGRNGLPPNKEAAVRWLLFPEDLSILP
jgi:hypothetical protein